MIKVVKYVNKHDMMMNNGFKTRHEETFESVAYLDQTCKTNEHQSCGQVAVAYLDQTCKTNELQSCGQVCRYVRGMNTSRMEKCLEM